MERMKMEALPLTLEVVEQGMADGLHLGAQAYLSLEGEPLAELAVGECRPGVPMTRDSIMLWLSACKPVAAVAILQLVERGRCRLYDRVAEHLPEFGQHGKQEITLRQLLTHTGGFRKVDTGWPESDWNVIIARICAAKLEPGWIPGRKAGYHIESSWYILGEIVRRLDGRSYGRYVREEIFLPLGMKDSWIGMPRSQYDAYGDRIGIMTVTEKQQHVPHAFSTALGAEHGSPGGGGHGPMRELAMFYEMLLGGGQRSGARVLQAESVAEMTRRERVGMFDETFRHVMDWGLGLIVNSRPYGAETVPYGYGTRASSDTFGHSGSQSSVAFADPQSRLVVALVFNGMPGERVHQRRLRQVLQALEEDLSAAGV
jgi:CubicO group peptidase (beta-lactamase class C family)